MKISAKDRKILDDKLQAIMVASQRSLVSLRKEDNKNLCSDAEKLAGAISEFIAEVGADVLPYSAV